VVLGFNSGTGDWTTLPPCPKHSFAIAVVGGLPTAVGGFAEGEGNSRSLLSLTGAGIARRWQSVYPAMTHARTCPSTAATRNLLVVAGGHGTEEGGRSVEVLHTLTMVWSIAAPLPFPLWRASAVTCGERLYLGGGEKEGNPLGCADVLYCSLADLETSHSNPTSVPVHKKFRKIGRSSQKVWHTAPKLPVLQFTLVACQKQLFAVGGQDRTTNSPVSDVYRFSPSSNKWLPCGHMTQPRSRCFAVALPDDQLMAVGGSVEPYTPTDSIEIAKLNL
jgi:hypothetical protein